MAAERVLVIEDDSMWVSLLGDWLSPHYELSWADSGAAGLAQIATLRPAAVVLDLHLGGMGGAEVLGRMRATAAGRMMPVVVFSSAVEDQALRRRLQALSAKGPLALASKGTKMGTLLAALRSVMSDA